MKVTFKSLLYSFSLIVLCVAISSCYTKKDTKAIITVVDSNNSPVSGAEVRLFYQNPALPAESVREGMDQTTSTNSAGKASFDYTELYKAGQTGFAVLDIYVDSVSSGIIKIEEETTSEETVVVQ